MDKGHFLSAVDICTIIKTCHGRGVTKLKLGALELEFEPPAESRHSKTPAPGPALPEISPGNVLQEQQQEETKSFEAEELRTRDEQLAELQLTNPAEYERLLELGEISEEAQEEPGDADE